MENLLSVSFDSEGLRSLIQEVVSSELAAQLKPVEQKKDELLTRKEAAKMLRISLVTLATITKNGKLPSYRVRGKVLFKKSDVEATLQKVVTNRYRRP
ncbi:MAG: helix-turn-helix domain-containing protein [Prolixibacteraceae bacterium]|nr:helix-turn-helix domain-containing protein [Prolixibacteraceae bacterium]